jgi:hypothetical protein
MAALQSLLASQGKDSAVAAARITKSFLAVAVAMISSDTLAKVD